MSAYLETVYRTCKACGKSVPPRFHFCADCSRQRQRKRKAEFWQKNKCSQLQVVEKITGIPTGEYIGHRLDVLAAAILGQAYRDSRQQWQDGEYVPPTERADAPGWWAENSRDWLEILGVDIAFER